MPLETGTYINSLVSSNPASTDGLAKADDHLRLLKSTLLATFPNVSGAITKTHTEINQGAVPTGVIVMWSGSVATIPAGWALCNGANGTPDLRGRFIVGAALSGYLVADIGGSATDAITTSSAGSHSHTAALAGAHTHGGSTGAHTLTIAQMPAHKHIDGYGEDLAGRYGKASALASAADMGRDGASTSGPYTSTEGGGAAHSHSISSDGDHTHTTDTAGGHTHTATVDTLPPYYALAYIMRL